MMWKRKRRNIIRVACYLGVGVGFCRFEKIWNNINNNPYMMTIQTGFAINGCHFFEHIDRCTHKIDGYLDQLASTGFHWCVQSGIRLFQCAIAGQGGLTFTGFRRVYSIVWTLWTQLWRNHGILCESKSSIVFCKLLYKVSNFLNCRSSIHLWENGEVAVRRQTISV